MASRGVRGREVREGFELLDDSSESEQEHFSMTPLGNNNSKERLWSSPSRKKKGERCCSLGMSLLFLLVVIVSACLAVLGVYTYSLQNRFTKLEQQVHDIIDEVTNPSQVQLNAPQGLKQVTLKQQNLEKRFEDQSREFTYITGNITLLYTQVSSVNQSVLKLEKLKLSESTTVDTHTLEQEVANLGSTVSSLQGDISTFPELQTTVNRQQEQIALIDKNTMDLRTMNHSILAHLHEDNIALQHIKEKMERLTVRLDLVGTSTGQPKLPNIHLLLQNMTLNQGESDTNNEAIIHLETLTKSLRDDIITANNSLNIIKAQLAQSSIKPTEKTPDNTVLDLIDYSLFRNSTSLQFKDINDVIVDLENRVVSIEHTLQVLDTDSPNSDGTQPQYEKTPSTPQQNTYSTNEEQMTTKPDKDEDNSQPATSSDDAETKPATSSDDAETKPATASEATQTTANESRSRVKRWRLIRKHSVV